MIKILIHTIYYVRNNKIIKIKLILNIITYVSLANQIKFMRI